MLVWVWYVSLQALHCKRLTISPHPAPAPIPTKSFQNIRNQNCIHNTQDVPSVLYERNTCFFLLDLISVIHPRTGFVFFMTTLPWQSAAILQGHNTPNLFAPISLQIDKLPCYIQKFLFLALLIYYTLSHSTTAVNQVKNSCTFFWSSSQHSSTFWPKFHYDLLPFSDIVTTENTKINNRCNSLH